MDEFRSEDEQIESIKKWWRENGTSVLISIGVAMALIFGYQYWQDSQRSESEAASQIFDQLVDANAALQSPDADDAQKKTHMSTVAHLTETLKTRHTDSVYAQFASLFEASIAVANNDIAKAKAALEWVLDQDVTDNNRTLVKLRLAKVLLMEGDYDAALDELDDATDAYQSAYDETRGDIYLAMNKQGEARQSYKAALEKLSSPNQNPALKIKYDNLAVVE